jgi:hypothetical protein
MFSYLFNSIVIALFDTYVIQLTWVIPNSIHAFVKHKNSSLISRIVQFSQIIWPCHPNSQIHIMQSTSFLPYLSYHSILINLKCWTNSFSIVCLIWLCCYWYGVFMLCYFCVIACTESYVFCWEKWKIVNSKKASDTHSSTHLLLLH